MNERIIGHGDAIALAQQASSALQDLQTFTGGAFMASAPRASVVVAIDLSVKQADGSVTSETVRAEFAGNVGERKAHGLIFDQISAAIDRLGATYPGSEAGEEAGK
jgi:hypothetical protein